MKKKICILLGLLSILIFAGCGHKIKDEEEIKEDLLESDFFSIVEGSEIEEFEIIKRRTDNDDKEDKVWVALELDHENAKETRAYILYYEEYNDGWELDDYEMYSDKNHEWKVTPKRMPSAEEVMEGLKEWSANKMKEADDNDVLTLDIIMKYYFSDNSYLTKIYSGEKSAEYSYQCIAETDRIWTDQRSKVVQLIHLYFNDEVYEWMILFDEVIDYQCSANEGTGLEQVGMIDMTNKQNVDPYIEKTEEYLTILYEEQDMEKIAKMRHPSYEDSFSYLVHDVKLNMSELVDATLLDVIPYYFIIYDKNSDIYKYNKEDFKEFNIDLEEIAECYFYVKVEYDGEIYYYSEKKFFIKENDKIYLVVHEE